MTNDHTPGPRDGARLERREFLAWAAAVAGAGLVGGCAAPPARADEDPPAAPAGPPRYQPRDYGALRGLREITDEQVEVHLDLYRGYVRRTNALLDDVRALREAGRFDATYQELQRRLGWEWDGMRLHELYFDNLAPEAAPLTPDGRFARAVAGVWGSVEAWRAELLATARMPGVGWVVCARDPATGNLWNGWVEDHEKGHWAGGTPLLVLDIWEHAFSVYRKPTERARYLDDVLANVDWAAVERRLG
ncbi:MAG: Fe-Mn family superoxide dismutase [Planctomycetes bacterium]|nr:Fe-Mn family superoxide dismutase [Planctomycetota bacterium]